MMQKLYKNSKFLLMASLMLLITGCKLSVLDPKGVVAAQEIHIMWLSVFLMLIVVIPVVFLAVYFSWRYRETNIKATYAPEWAHSTLLEIIWWSIPCAIILILGVITWKTSHTLDPYRSLKQTPTQQELTIQVIALQWKWLFIYPDQHIATVNEVVLPVNVPVRFDITSEGPMNSFFIPQLAGQIYAMAGMKSKLHLMANEVGDYQGLSANFSGRGFAGMKFIAHVMTEKDFAVWVTHTKKITTALDKKRYVELLKPSENHPVTYFTHIDPQLFDMALMRAMMPVQQMACPT